MVLINRRFGDGIPSGAKKELDWRGERVTFITSQWDVPYTIGAWKAMLPLSQNFNRSRVLKAIREFFQACYKSITIHEGRKWKGKWSDFAGNPNLSQLIREGHSVFVKDCQILA